VQQTNLYRNNGGRTSESAYRVVSNERPLVGDINESNSTFRFLSHILLLDCTLKDMVTPAVGGAEVRIAGHKLLQDGAAGLVWFAHSASPQYEHVARLPAATLYNTFRQQQHITHNPWLVDMAKPVVLAVLVGFLTATVLVPTRSNVLVGSLL
jgi:hypothetical protein